jgi:hypothetical protein
MLKHNLLLNHDTVKHYFLGALVIIFFVWLFFLFGVQNSEELLQTPRGMPIEVPNFAFYSAYCADYYWYCSDTGGLYPHHFGYFSPTDLVCICKEVRK